MRASGCALRVWVCLCCGVLATAGYVQGAGPTTTTSVATEGYTIEWVWLVGQNHDLLERAADRLTEKYRTALKIPSYARVPAKEWLGKETPLGYTWRTSTPMVVGGQEAVGTVEHSDSIPYGVAVQEARNEMWLINERIATKYDLAYANWLIATRRDDITTAAAIWQAQSDMTRVATLRDSSWSEQSYLHRRAVGAVQDKALELGLKSMMLVAGIDKMIGDAWNDFAVSQASDVLKEMLGKQLDDAMKKPDKAACTALSQTLAIIGDKDLFDRAYNLQRGNREPVLNAEVKPGSRDPHISEKYYALNGPWTRKEGYHTGIGLLIAQRDVLVPHVERMLNAVDPGAQVYLRGRDAIPVLENETSIVFQRGQLRYFSGPPGKGEGFFPELRRRYGQLKQELDDDTSPGVEAWFAVVSRGSASDASAEEKLHALAAVRLLRSDIMRFMGQNIDRRVRDWAIDKLADRLSGAPALKTVLGPLNVVLSDMYKDMFKAGIEATVDRLAPDQVKQLGTQLDAATAAIVTNLGIDAQIPSAFSGSAEVEAMLTPPKEFPPAFAVHSDQSSYRVDVDIEAGLYSAKLSITDSSVNPPRTSQATRYLVVSSGEKLEATLDGKLPAWRKEFGIGDKKTMRIESVRRTAGGASGGASQ